MSASSPASRGLGGPTRSPSPSSRSPVGQHPHPRCTVGCYLPALSQPELGFLLHAEVIQKLDHIAGRGSAVRRVWMPCSRKNMARSSDLNRPECFSQRQRDGRGKGTDFRLVHQVSLCLGHKLLEIGHDSPASALPHHQARLLGAGAGCTGGPLKGQMWIKASSPFLSAALWGS